MNDDQLKKLEGHTDRLVDATIGLLETLAVLSPMICDPRIMRDYGTGARARGFEVLRHALFCGIALDVVNLTCDNDKRCPSVRNIISILSDHCVVGILRQRYTDYNHPRPAGSPLSGKDVERINKKERDKRRKKFDRTLARANKAWDDFGVQSWLQGFKTLRDKHTAHLEVRLTADGYQFIDLAKLGLKLGDVGEAVERLASIAEDLNLVVRGAGFDMKRAASQIRADVAGFWA